MREYGGYTVHKIESELTWEQVFVLIETIGERYERQAEAYEGSDEPRDVIDIHDIAEGKRRVAGLPIVAKTV